MALNITSTVVSPQGEELQNLYGRVAVVNSQYGNRIEAGVDLYKDATAFMDGKQPFAVGFNTALSAPYNYDTDSKDILDLGHDLLISFLADQGVTAVKDLS